ncbi:MAG TPA: serine/threonine protein kinase, partial [Solirubrobacteraceae bacterium]|nr:serine/threonine protein kinase [Solirubrobacteraceae bacterium]
ALYLAADRAQHGAQATRNIPTPKNTDLVPFSIKQANAKDYDPLGDNRSEHPLQAKAVVDGERTTAWSTETYEGNTLGGKAGVGIYVIAEPSVAARAMEVLTPTKGWTGAVYGAKAGPVPSSIGGWGTRIGVIASAKTSQRVDLDTAGNRFRYYLVWITKLPPAANKVEISEIRLFR